MTIQNRDLPEGTRLVANYKKAQHVCVVEKGEEGKLAFVLEDGKKYTSPSAAASAVMGGIAANGWRFWTIDGDAPAPAQPKAVKAPRPSKKAEGAKKAAKPKRTPKATRLISRAKSQAGAAEGEARFFCDACMDSFTAPAGEEPDECPNGHRTDDPELTAPVTAEAGAAEAEAESNEATDADRT